MSVKEMLRIILKDNKRHHETLMKQMDESFRKLEETMDRCLKNMNETLDSTSEGTKAVSYTHLDVYKRQITNSEDAGL